jgi:hypothetical protein
MRSLADGWDRHQTSGSEMCYHISKGHGKVIQRTTVRGLIKAEWESETERQLAKGLIPELREKLGKNASQWISLTTENQRLRILRSIRMTR